MLMLKQPEFGELVREMRHCSGLTQEELASKIGVSYASLNRWENCRTMPVGLVVKRVREVLVEMGDRGQDLLEHYFLEE